MTGQPAAPGKAAFVNCEPEPFALLHACRGGRLPGFGGRIAEQLAGQHHLDIDA